MTEVIKVEESWVRLRPLSLVDEGADEVLVGDVASGDFISIPKVGGIVIQALQRGASTAEAAAEAANFAGEPVDVPSFVETLRDLGFVDDGHESAPSRSAPLQARTWMSGVRPEAVRPFFTTPAWIGYGLCGLLVIMAFLIWPRSFPDPTTDPFVSNDIGLGALVLIPITLISAASHEVGHWLAARAAGVQARFGVDRRAVVLLVFETDLTQTWALPRRQRYSPLLAGIAFDTVLLAIALSLRLPILTGHWAAPRLVDQLLAAWIYAKLAGLLWQCMLFLRTDLYGVLVNALQCRNLWTVSGLMLRSHFGGLNPTQVAELNEAHPRDCQVARWFQWMRLAGLLLVAAWVAFFLAPFVWELATWTAARLTVGPDTIRFWWALGCGLVALAPYLLPLLMSVTELLRRRRTSLDGPASA